MNIRDAMRRAAGFNRDKPAIIAGDYRLTFGEAWERGTRLANALLDAGLKPGDACGSLEDNTVEAVDFFLGCAIAGVIRVPLYARNARSSHLSMLDHTDCKAIVVAEHYADQVEGMENEIDTLDQVIVRSAAGYEDWLAGFSSEDPNPEIDENELYVIRHTGGTTGHPKGVPFTHKAWLDIGRNWFYTMPPVGEGDVCMHIAPISHASGYQFVPVWLSGGCNLVVEKYAAAPVVDQMVTEKVSYVFMAPTMVGDVMNVPGVEMQDWSSMKVLLIGAAPITEANVRKAYDIWGDSICSLYGQSEGVPVTISMANEWVRDDIPGSTPMRSVGRIHPFCDVKIADPDTHALMPMGEEGEICFKNDGQLTGYWRNESATEKTVYDGWVHTGDIGYVDQNGYLYMCDRKDDMILSGGYNIWPTELENVIATHPGVQEVVVIGVPNERFGESPYALIMEKEAGAVKKEDIIDMCATELGSYKKPSDVEIGLNPLPRTPVGKVSRKMIREPYWEGLGRRK
ncbi:AMP-dependent synthetase [Gammaproteobacteria bacterium 45_16_T64]|nr:AMP-dependent synthetase [Gammaproteobacteria bacterium 45_16_T64]